MPKAPKLPKTSKIPKPSKSKGQVTDFQESVYSLLLQIPQGRVTTYASLARALSTSPRAVGNALHNNPFAPHVPCHRVIASSGYIGGFLGDWEKAPSGVNQSKKRALLGEEGVGFDEDGMICGTKGGGGKGWLFDGPWDLGRKGKGKGVGIGRETEEGVEKEEVE